MIQNKFNRSHSIQQSEILFFICSFLLDIGFTYKTSYLLVKRKFFRLSFLAANSKSTNLQLKMSRFDLKNKNNAGSLVGYYRAVW
jgi:hypothetical protein